MVLVLLPVVSLVVLAVLAVALMVGVGRSLWFGSFALPLCSGSFEPIQPFQWAVLEVLGDELV